MTDLLNRSDELEIMDDLDCHGEVVYQTLRELETINRLLGGDYVTLTGINKLIKGKKGPFSIADLGCGGGDMAIKIIDWGKKKNVNLHVTGVDANPHIIDFAKKNCARYPDINFVTESVFSPSFQEVRYDLLLATLFIHHFTEAQLVELFASMKKQATIGIVINDIHRHSLAFHSIRLLTRFFSKSAMVKFDAPLSVRRAFKRKDLDVILRKAGIDKYSLKWRWAFRWQLIIPCGQSLAQFS